jgi:hypothetical protein
MKETTRAYIAVMIITTVLSIVIILTVSNITFKITQKALNRRSENQKVRLPICKMYYEYNVYRIYNTNCHRIDIDTIPIDTICIKSYVP